MMRQIQMLFKSERNCRIIPNAMMSIVFPSEFPTHKKNLTLWLLVIFFLAGAAVEASAQNMSFPGVRSESKAPNGRFVIKNFDSDTEDPAHSLTLIDRQTGSKIRIYLYGRGVDILWSPDSTAFVINDHEGSDAAHPVLFTQPWSTHFSDLRQGLIDFLRTKHQEHSFFDNGHVYFTAERWLHNDELLCELTGYGEANPKGFTKRYVYKLAVGFRSYE